MSRRRETVTVATINAAGVTSGGRRTLTNVLTAMPGVSVGLIQEAGPVKLRRRLSRLLGVAQARRSYARRGSAVVWDRSTWRAVDRWSRVMSRPNGHRIRSRYAAGVVLQHKRTRRRVLFIAAHRPPGRDRELWRGFDDHLAAAIESSRYPVVVGIDANQRHPYLRDVARNHRPDGSIDVILTHGIKAAGPARRMPATRSDHRPIAMEIYV